MLHPYYLKAWNRLQVGGLCKRCSESRLILQNEMFQLHGLSLRRFFPPERFAKTTFSATQRCKVVAILFTIVPTLFQHCCPKYASLQIVSYINAFRNYILSLRARSKPHLNYITRALVEPFAKISPMLSGPNVLVLKTFIF